MATSKINRIRQLISGEKPSLGTRIWSTYPFFTEAVGSTGNFDYVEFVGEYSAFSQYDFSNIARAAELHDMGTMIKVDFYNCVYIAQKAVAAGFQAVLFTDHHTPDEIRETVRGMKPDSIAYDYKGRFGFPNQRYIGFQPVLPQMDHAKRVDDVVLAFMIEKKEAVDNIEEICSIPGVDMVQFGPSDYCMSQGWNMKDHQAECREALAKVITAAQKHGVVPRCEIYGPIDQAKKQAEEFGVKHFCYGDEFMTALAFWRDRGKEFRDFVNSL
jgi:2-keto-3-deoxy-L-rhamnonate aldolase RhmA